MKLALVIICLILLLIQFIRPERIQYSKDDKYEIKASEEIREILVKACYDCHSNKIAYPWYSQIAPFSWVIVNHTKEGVRALNFSQWEKYTPYQKNEKLKSIYRTVYVAMPLKSYTLVHKDANITKAQREKLRDWTGVRK